jgi:hypothetical protein
LAKYKPAESCHLDPKFIKAILKDNVTNAYNWNGWKPAKALSNTLLFSEVLPDVLCDGKYDHNAFISGVKKGADKVHRGKHQSEYKKRHKSSKVPGGDDEVDDENESGVDEEVRVWGYWTTEVLLTSCLDENEKLMYTMVVF